MFITGALGVATNQGLGIQMRAFIDHGIIDKILLLAHSVHENHYEWYEGKRIDNIEELLKCDKIFFMETLYNHWKLIPEARKTGAKTILIVHYECTPSPLPYIPDVIIAPSDLDKEYYPEAVRINIPVDMSWQQRTQARVFVHNAGHGGLGGRNGTQELIEAMQYVKSPIKLLIRTQSREFKCNDPRVEIIQGTVPFEELYSVGDVFVFTDKFQGSSLPQQEAFASGMPVIATDRNPSNTWLPKELLVAPKGYKKERISREFDCAILDPVAIAQKIDEVYNMDITELSLRGKKWGEENSWSALKEKYLNL